MIHPYLSRRVARGESIRPWIGLGPHYESLPTPGQGPTMFERPGSRVGAEAADAAAAEASRLLTTEPREGETASFRGREGRWEIARRPDPFPGWGTYNVDNTLVVLLLSTRVTPDEPGPSSWRLLTRLFARVIVALNGEVVLDATPRRRTPEGPWEHLFEAELRPGPNVLNVALLRIGRMAHVSCLIEALDRDLTVEAPIADGLDLQARAALEDAAAGLALERDLLRAGESVVLTAARAAPTGGTLRACVLAADGRTVVEAPLPGPGRYELARAEEVGGGPCRVLCRWHPDDGAEPVPLAEFELRALETVPAPPGHAQLAERRRMVLEHFAAEREHSWDYDPIWPEVARYALGEPPDEAAVRAICAFIGARNDCADFAIQGLLRLMYWEAEAERTGRGRRLSPELTALMKDTVLGFKYWVDEPGDSLMWFGTENHRLLFHVAEWLAGQLFPLEEFANSGQRGLYHATKGRAYLAEWLRQRGRFGFDEWHSNSYFAVELAPLANVYDFAPPEEGKLRQLAAAVLDYAHFILAADTFDGVFGTTHGRSYGDHLRYPELELTASTCWLQYGTGRLARGARITGMAPVSLASSGYAVPEILADIATDREAIVESCQRQGLFPGTPRHANFVVYRTPDYMLSAPQDHRKGEREPSTHVAQVTLGNGALIFWSCPETIGGGSGLRPDYWSGHHALPRAVQHRNVLALTWRCGAHAWMTHCFFEQCRFDEVRFADGTSGRWAFARVADGYVGVWSEYGFEVGAVGQFSGRELVCEAPENTWLAECGRAADWGGFDAFVAALSAAPVGARGGAVTYASPSIGELVTGWDVEPTAGGRPIPLRGYPLVESPWARSAFGSGELTIAHHGREHTLWFTL